MSLQRVTILLQEEFVSAKELQTRVHQGLTRMGISCPTHIPFWQFLSCGRMRYGVHLTLTIEGVSYRFERNGSGLHITEETQQETVSPSHLCDVTTVISP